MITKNVKNNKILFLIVKKIIVNGLTEINKTETSLSTEFM